MPSAAESETTKTTTAAARTDVNAPILDGKRHRLGRASRVLTARADASAAPRASARSASAAVMTGTAAPWKEVAIESMSSAEPRTKIASGWTPLRSSRREHVVGGRINALGRHPVVVDQRNESVVGFDDANCDVAIAATIGDARRQGVSGLLL